MFKKFYKNNFKRGQSGQALTEYILLIVFVSLSVLATFKIFRRYIQLIFQEHVRSLGYEIPSEKSIAEMEKRIIEVKLKAIKLKEEIEDYWTGEK